MSPRVLPEGRMGSHGVSIVGRRGPGGKPPSLEYLLMQHILGQPRAIETLQSVLQSGRIHHAWIFSGPFGVGKFTTAEAFATILLDPDAAPDLSGQIASDPDGRIPTLIRNDSHPDHHVIRKELALYSSNAQLRSRKLLNIPLDLLRERMIGGQSGDGKRHEALAFKTAALNHGKVFIIDEAELIDRNGQNAMLKTLEEPPPRTYIILVTSRPERLLPTIHSRCQHVRFTPLDEDAMAQWVARQELDLTPEALAWVLRFAQGSPGRALLAAEYGLDEWAVELTPMLEQLERGDFPPDLGETMASFVGGFAEAWVKNHDNASKDAANKDGARQLFSLLATHARGRIDDALAAGTDPEPYLDVIDLIADAERQLFSNVNMKIVLENLAAQWRRRLSGERVEMVILG